MAVYTWEPAVGGRHYLLYHGKRTGFWVVAGATLWYARGFPGGIYFPYTPQSLGRGNQAQAKILAIRAHKAQLRSKSAG